jgi:hypothetical protein
MNNIFTGTHYRLANNWFSVINVEAYINKPINYLEIGTFYGANLLSVANSYGLHNDSKLYCIDPWEDYDNYSEYKGLQPTIYNTFITNVENSGFKDKIFINRGFSNQEIPKFEDNFFDIILNTSCLLTQQQLKQHTRNTKYPPLGIEPTEAPWKLQILPLNQRRSKTIHTININTHTIDLSIKLTTNIHAIRSTQTGTPINTTLSTGSRMWPTRK